MDVEQLMKLIDKVSESDLTGFKYEENGTKLNLSEKDQKWLIRTMNMLTV